MVIVEITAAVTITNRSRIFWTRRIKRVGAQSTNRILFRFGLAAKTIVRCILLSTADNGGLRWLQFHCGVWLLRHGDATVERLTICMHVIIRR